MEGTAQETFLFRSWQFSSPPHDKARLSGPPLARSARREISGRGSFSSSTSL